jgi:hypothetical protein
MEEIVLPVPPCLEQALGYDGEARWVSFYWVPVLSGHGTVVDDGDMVSDGHWEGFFAFIDHPHVAPHLAPYHLGSNEAQASHHLLLDRHTRTLYVAPQPLAAHQVQQQWRQQASAPSSDAELHHTAPAASLYHAALAPSGGVYERYVAELCDWLDSHPGLSSSPSGSEGVGEHIRTGDMPITSRQDALRAAEGWIRQRYRLDNPSLAMTAEVVEETTERWIVRVLIGSGMHVTLYVWPSGGVKAAPLVEQQQGKLRAES